MRRELEHFYIGSSYGGNQSWFRTFMMRIGGCGAETACDSSIYFALHKGISDICPIDTEKMRRKDYVDFAHHMEKYLWPRMTGIDKPEIYIEGYSKYLNDRGVDCISMSILQGSESFQKAIDAVKAQTDAGYPIPALILNHKDRKYRDYVWHWFLINGYDIREDGAYVKAVNYSTYEWLNMEELWDTGYSMRGGLVLFNIAEQ